MNNKLYIIEETKDYTKAVGASKDQTRAACDECGLTDAIKAEALRSALKTRVDVVLNETGMFIKCTEDGQYVQAQILEQMIELLEEEG